MPFSEAWSIACNDLIYRVTQMYPEWFTGVCMLPQNPKSDLAASIVRLVRAWKAEGGASPLVPVETMTAYIVQVSLGDTPQGTLEYRTIFAVGMLLFLGTFGLNLVSAWLRERYREEYT